ncbi:enoyl-CoA hydratase [Actinophytocola xinjiangensis]|uniref:Enoyl-CoA hydratase n=1 Tax=Actinophytocola xinjiangensis TaxID=485602 RepID=A0A7Z0WPN1_9PSEU|nr:crotonase/enoyl-CoA hydratase family protein [Actinophytocola xinjiangensis]OLF12072.1 enoyl-CoA hydratase [Actinophytocola xinjiangensis]
MSEVLVERRDRTLVITINRPERRNAMTRAAGELIAEALDQLDADDTLSVGVLTGAGGTFCSGMDLRRFAAGELASVPGRGFAGLTQRPPDKPLIAAVEGHAVAGGFETVLACDLVVAARGAKFGLPEVRRGLVARAGGLMRLPQLIPRSAAMRLVLTGDTVDAAQAHTWGLVTELVEDGTALEHALALAERIARNAPLAVRVSKQVMAASADWPAGERFARQAELTDPVFDSADAVEGAQAFVDKREPRWTGR